MRLRSERLKVHENDHRVVLENNEQGYLILFLEKTYDQESMA
jgi:hypothetical protein